MDEHDQNTNKAQMNQDEILAYVAQTCRRAAQGDLEARITGVDADGPLYEAVHAINHMLDIADCYVRESAASMEHCSREEFFRPILLRGLPGGYLKSANVINQAAIHMRDKATRLEQLEEERLGIAKQIEGSALKLNQFSESFEKASGKMTRNAKETLNLSSEAFRVSQQTEENVDSIASACEELVSTTSSISEQTEHSRGMVEQLVTDSREAQKHFDTLNEASNKIISVVELIDRIAKQTNLLALNATIEAARAGEAGKGFAVVASEVKDLSRNTGSATEEINEVVEDMKRIMHEAMTSIDHVNSSIRAIETNTNEISRSLSEQNEVTREISKNMASASAGSRKITGSMKAVSTAASETGEMADEFEKASAELNHQSEVLEQEVKLLLGEKTEQINVESTHQSPE